MTMLRTVWDWCYRHWMRFAHVLGIVNTTVLLTIVYVVVVLPMRLLWWALRKDPLIIHRRTQASMWFTRTQDEPTLEDRRHPF